MGKGSPKSVKRRRAAKRTGEVPGSDASVAWKRADFGQGAIGEAIEGLRVPGKPEGFIRRLSMTVFLSLTERDASTKPNVQRSGRVSNAIAQRPFGEEMSIRARNVQS